MPQRNAGILLIIGGLVLGVVMYLLAMSAVPEGMSDMPFSAMCCVIGPLVSLIGVGVLIWPKPGGSEPPGSPDSPS